MLSAGFSLDELVSKDTHAIIFACIREIGDVFEKVYFILVTGTDLGGYDFLRKFTALRKTGSASDDL